MKLRAALEKLIIADIARSDALAELRAAEDMVKDASRGVAEAVAQIGIENQAEFYGVKFGGHHYMVQIDLMDGTHHKITEFEQVPE